MILDAQQVKHIYAFFLQHETLAKAKELNANLLFHTQLDFDTRILTPLDNYFSIQQILLIASFFLADCNKLALNWSEHTEVPAGRRGSLTQHSPCANSCTSSTVTLPPSFFF